MAEVKGLEKALSLNLRGKLGRAGGFGRVTFGYNSFGFYSPYFGIFQKHYYYGRGYTSRMRFYRPTNPQTVPQQNWRATAAYAWVLWAALTDDQKYDWRQRAQALGITGANLFMSHWLKNPPAGFGSISFGYNRFGFY